MSYINREALYKQTAEWEAQAFHMVEATMNDKDLTEWKRWSTILNERSAFKFDVADFPTADVVEIPETGMGDLSDGYHTFNSLYEQRLILFAVIVKQNKSHAWKSLRHENGELCFDGGWFIVGIDTPEGSYTYHYEVEYWDLFDCQELPTSKPWDGHTDKDVSRLLSLTDDAERKKGKWIPTCRGQIGFYCSVCGEKETNLRNYCPNCGADMKEVK